METTDMETISVKTQVNSRELMSAVFFGIWRSTSPWFHPFAYDEDEYTPGMRVSIVAEDPDDQSKSIRKDVNASMLASGLEHLIGRGAGHCGEKITADLDEWDACVSDQVLQVAIYGDVIYG